MQQPKEWLLHVGPYASLIFKTLRLVVPIAKDIAGVSLSDAQFQQAKQELELMKTLVDKLPNVDIKKLELEAENLVTASQLTPAEGAAHRALRELLFKKTTPAHSVASAGSTTPPATSSITTSTFVSRYQEADDVAALQAHWIGLLVTVSTPATLTCLVTLPAPVAPTELIVTCAE